MKNFARQIGERISLAREAKGMTQESFAKALGLNNHQTVSAIETGLRQLQPDELVRACQILQRSLSFFTDPYVVTETSGFSYRAKPNSTDIDAFETKARNLISANRRFRDMLDESASPMDQQLRGLTAQSTLKDATAIGETVARAFKLGDLPAHTLRDKIESVCKVMVLFVDAPQSISGAACHLADGDYILINRSEPSFRRNFNLGHELFHILTWRVWPPKRFDPEVEGDEKPKAEKLADAFTAGLLMPQEQVSKSWQTHPSTQGLHEAILAVARQFHVSGIAMYWRLRNCGLLSKSQAESVDRDTLSRPEDHDPARCPNLYNAEFVRRMHNVLQRGLVSTRKVSELLDCDPEDLLAICAAYSFSPSIAS